VITWLAPVAILLIVVLAGARVVIRRRAARQAQALASADEADARDERAWQFLQVDRHSLTLPRVSVSDLRANSQATVEHAEVRSDLTTLDAFLVDVRDAMGADEAVFWQWGEQRDSLLPVAWSSPGPKPKFFDMHAWGTILRWVASERMTSFDTDARLGVARLAAAPIVHDERLLGVLSVARAQGLERGREHVKNWLPRHAAQVGRLLSLFELRREYSRHMRQSRALLTAAERLQGHKSQEALTKAICETALQVTSATDAALVRWRADVGRGWVHHTTPGFKHRSPFGLTADSLVARTCTDGTLFMMDDVAQMTGVPSVFFEGDAGWKAGSLAIVPLKRQERVIGAIVIATEVAAGLPRDEARNVTLLGALAAPSLEVVWEMEEVSKRARTDPLTDLPNRRAFDDQLGTLLLQADRFGHSVSLIVVDIDHFKNVNDTWGHEAGDAVLKSIAASLVEGIRKVDLCARFGGEEFAILLPETTLTGATELADRLRRSVAGRAVVTGGVEIPVTISCGVSSYPEGVLSKEALFAAADRALYEAKNAGRNCVKAAAPKPTGVSR
jgi:diguanylate cyclase (GGDEF)-like protein